MSNLPCLTTPFSGGIVRALTLALPSTDKLAEILFRVDRNNKKEHKWNKKLDKLAIIVI